MTVNSAEGSRGYNPATVKTNRAANGHRIGVKLGRFCIKNGIPVEVAAHSLGVTKWTIYRWFSGASEPHRTHGRLIKKFIDEFIAE